MRSRELEKGEQKYCETRREMLAVVYFTNYFQDYSLGRKFFNRSDHSLLRWLQQFRNPDGLVYRWLEQLSKFDYDIEHRPGSKHSNADFLSRVCKPDGVECRQCHMPLDELGNYRAVQVTAEINDDVSIGVLDIDEGNEEEEIVTQPIRVRRKWVERLTNQKLQLKGLSHRMC